MVAGCYPVLGYLHGNCMMDQVQMQVQGININHTDQITLQNLLRAVRKEAGISQQELAARLDKPQSFVSKYESGERRLDILEILQICKGVGISLAIFSSRLEDQLTVNNHAAR
jgi:ribosome-binding protein aMBF1 (putative translation factor)